tara:strand:+ start:1764 stop:2321 length:558 start_codon:yes stop_codon:yes gene_type:complete
LSKNKNFSDTAASRYSLALYELAEENKYVQEIEDQSSALVKLIDQSEEFESIIRNPTNKKEDQINVINKIAENYNFNILLKNFLCFLVEKKRLFFLKNILRKFVDICSQKRGEVKARLEAAKQLSNEEIVKIKDEISKDFTNKVKLEYKYNPSLIGGLIIQVGSVMIDTSIKNKLKKLENKMIEA